MQITLNSRFSFIDVETTGSRAGGDRIIELGIVVVENQQVVHKLSTLVNPEDAYVSPFIVRLTGIDPYDLIDAPTFQSIHRDVYNLIHGSIFVAHNVQFDYGFLRGEFARLGIELVLPTLCSVKLSRALFPQYKRHNLDEVTARCNIRVKNRHRAYDDAHAIWDFMQHIAQKFDHERVHSAITSLLKDERLYSSS